MKKQTLIYFTDSGHGWLKVSRDDLATLGLTEKISLFSYTRGDSVYLEEDCDMTAYMIAADNAGWTVKLRGRNSDRSKIRSYEPYHAAREFARQHITFIHIGAQA